MSGSEIRIFIASPGDCIDERETVRRIVRDDASIRFLCNNLKVAIKDFGWEDVHSDLGRPQSIINVAIERFAPDWFIFIFRHRFGSEAGMGMTGTEEEWDLARRMHEKGDGHPWVSLYFNTASVNPYEINSMQFEKLKEFRNKVFSEYQGLAKSFNSIKEFEEIFRSHVVEKILNYFSINGQRSLGIDSIKSDFLESSRSLLTWPRTLKNGREIKRAEIDDLINKVQQSEASTTLILGSPGTGKSSLMASLTQHFVDQGTAILAIKADMLERQIDTRDRLSKWLNLSLDIKDAIKYLANEGPVIVLIDQLDALSELLDRKSERLNLLLNLIQSLSNVKGVHIIATSREFEYRHDIRLTSIEAERLVLQLPSWEDVQSELTTSGYKTETFSDGFKEILRIPLHLKIYLDIAEPGNTAFTSLQALLEKLWESKILASERASRKIALLEKMANTMADNEVLWLPIATCDEYISERNSLLQADILTLSSNNMNIGFRHQTYYDYTLARAFARGTIILSDYVIERQNGLFIRPILISGLNYLRERFSSGYHKQLEQLLRSDLRIHIRMLVLEFLGEQKDPDDFEASIIIPMLISEVDGPKILASVAGSPGWFWRIYHSGILYNCMMKISTEAAYCVPLLISSINIATNEILDLIETNWLSNREYDSLSISILANLDNWNAKADHILIKIVQRDYTWGVENIVEKLIEIDPDSAIKIISVDLGRRLNDAIIRINCAEEKDISGMSEEEQIVQSILYKPYEPIERIIEDQSIWYNIESYAESNPKQFIKWIWPWFIELISTITNSEHPFMNMYKSDHITYVRFMDDKSDKPILNSVFIAVIKLAEISPEEFKEFATKNECLDYLIVHRIISHALLRIVSYDPIYVLNYLINDSRRFMIGDYIDDQYETKKLVAAVYPKLQNEERLILDNTLLNMKRYKVIKLDWSVKDRFERQKWERQDRLRLLRVIPDDCLSPSVKRVRCEEERALPNTDNGERIITGGFIGPRLVANEMQKADDEDILNLFSELSDKTGWDNPTRRFVGNYARAGGAVQLSREFFEFAKMHPERTINLIVKLKPSKHEMYVSKGIEGLEEANIPSNDLFKLIKDFNCKGFKTVEFYNGIANALEKRAEKDNGLPDEILLILQEWLYNYDKPSSSEPANEEKHSSILFGRGTFTIPQGPGSILRAIALGYLKREPSDIDKWILVINHMLRYEHNSEVWALALNYMGYIFAYDKETATKLLDDIIKTYPNTLKYHNAIYSLARYMRFCEPTSIVKQWLNVLVSIDSSFCHQAYGEMLLIYYVLQSDIWIVDQVNGYLENVSDNDVITGIAYSAVNMWGYANCQQFATDIICRLITNSNEEIQKALSGFFLINDDKIILNANVYRIIEAIFNNKNYLIRCADSLLELMMDYIAIDPNLVSIICQNILDAAGSNLNDYSNSLASSAEPLTNIALTLHRLPDYREKGLRIFERLLELNISETRAALEVLDRKPLRKTHTQYLRRVRRRRTKKV